MSDDGAVSDVSAGDDVTGAGDGASAGEFAFGTHPANGALKPAAMIVRRLIVRLFHNLSIANRTRTVIAE